MADAPALTQADEALLALLRRLDAAGLRLRHADAADPRPGAGRGRKSRRPATCATYWAGACPFAPEVLTRPIARSPCSAPERWSPTRDHWKSTIRVSRVHGLLFLHSAYPTEAEDSVFLGPDSYRFADFIARELGGRSWIGRTADVGGGAGVGALTAALGRQAREVVAHRRQPQRRCGLARLNAVQAGVRLIGR